MRFVLLLVLLALPLVAAPLSAAELAVLTHDNWDRLAPPGKEADCILGDFVLKSDRVWVVVAQPLPSRNANMTVRQVAGAVIDLTVVEQPNDQLGAFYPGRRQQRFVRAEVIQPKGKKVVLRVFAPARSAKEIEAELAQQPRPVDYKPPAKPEPVLDQPEVRVDYELEDGQPFLFVRSVFTNVFDRPIDLPLEDDLRADNFDQKVKAGDTDLFWAHDHYFQQAYGVVAERHRLRSRSDVRNSVIAYLPSREEKPVVRLAPGQSHELVRRLIAGPSLLAVKGEAARLAGQSTLQLGWHVVDPLFKPIAGADLTLKQDDTVHGSARTDSWGWVKADLPPGKYTLTLRAPGRAPLERRLDLSRYQAGDVIHTEYEMETASVVVADIRDDKGGPIPCKVQFKGTNGTLSPNWGPPAAREAVVNLYYSATGRFTVPINPGSYEAIISYGPEYDVVRVPLTVGRGARVPLSARLKRAFATPGWVSADFHSHSSPSGDNTSDQRGRVLNLLCEHIQFAPCTEHNRIDSYTPHLKALGVEKLMGTCPGIELTGTPLPLNHQNAFPLVFKPRTQDGGAPLTDFDPPTQIRRLADWDNRAEKLVQQNHPDIGWLFFDRNGDGMPDNGFQAGFPFMQVIEVHPIHEILELEPTRLRTETTGRKVLQNHTVFNWLQLLNHGYRIPGVVNTDAHYNFHGSGGLRNYVRCDAVVPGDIDPLEIVRHARQGHIVMSTGPFLDVKLDGALPGDDLKPKNGKATLAVRVFCPNWFDIDRVQVLINGRPEPGLNFTRRSHPGLFRDQAERFAHQVELTFPRDAHVIVVAIGEESELGEVMGPLWGRQRPTAISNPIFVDPDANGFVANRDTLGHPLPVKGGKPAP